MANQAIAAATARFVKRALRQAEQPHAAWPVIELDTPDGLLDSTHKIVREVISIRVPVVVEVEDYQAAHQATLDRLRVGELMSTDFITAAPDDRVEQAMGLMTEHRVRHLPVLVDGRLFGIVSIGDVVKRLYDQVGTGQLLPAELQSAVNVAPWCRPGEARIRLTVG